LIPILTILVASVSFAFAQTSTPAPTEPASSEHGGVHGGGQCDPEARFKQLATNGDGFISLEEFKASPMGPASRRRFDLPEAAWLTCGSFSAGWKPRAPTRSRMARWPGTPTSKKTPSLPR